VRLTNRMASEISLIILPSSEGMIDGSDTVSLRSTGAEIAIVENRGAATKAVWRTALTRNDRAKDNIFDNKMPIWLLLKMKQ
jgi:hypothetical protein